MGSSMTIWFLTCSAFFAGGITFALFSGFVGGLFFMVIDDSQVVNSQRSSAYEFWVRRTGLLTVAGTVVAVPLLIAGWPSDGHMWLAGSASALVGFIGGVFPLLHVLNRATYKGKTP